MKINERIKEGASFFNRHPAYLSFCGALIGVFIGGLISLYSIKYGKEIDISTTRKNHIEQLYLNLEFSFALFKDRLIRYYRNDWEVSSSEKIFKQQNIENQRKSFYENKFLAKLKKRENDENLFTENMATFYRDYKALKLYIDLRPFDRYFSSTFDSSLLSQIDCLKRIPAGTLSSYNSSQVDSIDKLLDMSILEIHKNSDSVFTLIHKQVSLEFNK